MKKNIIIFVAFALMVASQIYVPASMILSQEDILTSGTTFKFKAAPVDPADPFRGRYVVLSFEENQFEQDTGIWKSGETIFVHLSTDYEGFAEIFDVSKEAPDSQIEYLKTTVLYPPTTYNNNVTIDYPFYRFYMEEFKATEAERTYWNSLRDTSKVTYAVVNIKDGEYALRDVMINGVSLRHVVETEEK